MEAKYTEIIDKYLNGQLTREDLIAFKEKLKSDTQLQKELRLEQDLNQLIGEEDVLDFRAELATVRGEMLNERQNKRTPSRTLPFNRRMLLAASIIILVGMAAYFYFMQNQSHSFDHLYASYYQPYPADIGIRSDKQKNNEFSQGLSAYKQGDFESSKNLLDHYLQSNPDNLVGHLYLGIACMETNSFADARRHFKIIIDDKNNLFIEQAKWYLCLSYLKQSGDQDHEVIRKLLQSLINSNGDRAKEAKSLLEKID